MGNILSIKRDIKINTGDLNLYIDIDKIRGDGTVERIVDNQPAHSLVANFGRMLFMMMTQGYAPDGLYYNKTNTTLGNQMLAWFGVSMNTIASVTPGNPTRVVFSGATTDWDNTGNEGIQLMGIGGITPDINGFWNSSDATYISSTTVDLNVDTTGSPAFVDEGARARVWREATGADATDNDFNTFGAFRLAVGRGTVANVTDQQCLENEFDAADTPTITEPYELIYTDTVVSNPSFNFTTNFGELFFSGIVSNNTGATQTINELGLYAAVQHATNDYRYALIARDLVSPGVSLDQGESAVAIYRLRTGLDANGGILEQFLRLLFRQFDYSGVNTTVKDVNDADNTWHEDWANLFTMAMAGEGTINGLEIGLRADDIGIQVGTSNTAVSMNDRKLVARVDHGEASGELVQYGQIVHDFQVAGSTATFKLVKYFENLSGGTINLNEVGIYVSGNEFDAQLFGNFCIYRDVLTSTQAVNNGDILKVEITFTVTVV